LNGSNGQLVAKADLLKEEKKDFWMSMKEIS